MTLKSRWNIREMLGPDLSRRHFSSGSDTEGLKLKFDVILKISGTGILDGGRESVLRPYRVNREDL